MYSTEDKKLIEMIKKDKVLTLNHKFKLLDKLKSNSKYKEGEGFEIEILGIPCVVVKLDSGSFAIGIDKTSYLAIGDVKTNAIYDYTDQDKYALPLSLAGELRSWSNLEDVSLGDFTMILDEHEAIGALVNEIVYKHVVNSPLTNESSSFDKYLITERITSLYAKWSTETKGRVITVNNNGMVTDIFYNNGSTCELKHVITKISLENSANYITAASFAEHEYVTLVEFPVDEFPEIDYLIGKFIESYKNRIIYV